MIVIGIDPHKSSHTATAVDPATNTDLGSIRIDATRAGYTTLIAWATTWPQRTWAVENAYGLGYHLAQWLLTRGEIVLDVPTTATARVRELSRGGRRKNDRIDAAAAACVAAAQGDARPVDPEGPVEILALLDERRTNLSGSRTRIVNQLHALLRQLLAGGAPTSLSAAAAIALLRNFRAKSAVDRMRVGLCRDLIADIRRLDIQLAANEKQMSATLDEHGTHLREIDGIGSVTAACLIGRTRRASRFPTAAAYTTYNGSAPVQIASADTDRHRLSRYGDRQLNSALYTVAVVQIRMPASAGRAYYDKKIAEDKKPAAARRASNVTYPIMSGASCSPTKDTDFDQMKINPPGRLDKQRGTPGVSVTEFPMSGCAESRVAGPVPGLVQFAVAVRFPGRLLGR
ncbi:IS110 family transposase [Rhodococcus sp. CC-R104]|uniref:IS110 family transposase n=1 Tax=Rhodococcus chondri TaxID=3065941 RepID=A0ABU7JP71_9NOCA|nr:IS110 family transposase [Rhodococcus sp. CC-R104]MEE2031274.1 IS110 family transposase [Rhodococcus sp. CC-R104]